MTVMTRNDVRLPLYRGARTGIITPERKAWLRKIAASAGQFLLFAAVMAAIVASVIGLKAYFVMSRMPLVF